MLRTWERRFGSQRIMADVFGVSLGCVEKVWRQHRTTRVQAARAVYRQRLAARDCRRLQCVDAAGVKLALTRLYGRAPRGTRVIGSVPQIYGPQVTMLGAQGPQGLQAVMTVESATAAEVVRTSVKRVLGPAPWGYGRHGQTSSRFP
jgi:hypothetical protein